MNSDISASDAREDCFTGSTGDRGAPRGPSPQPRLGLGYNLDCGHMMAAELETYTLVVTEPPREDEPGRLLSRPKVR
jgi:hypothetical protein